MPMGARDYAAPAAARSREVGPNWNNHRFDISSWFPGENHATHLSAETRGPKHMTYQCDLQDYLFDLRGFIIIKNAISPEWAERLSQTIDKYLDLKYLEWRGNIQRFDNNGNSGIELQNIVAVSYTHLRAH